MTPSTAPVSTIDLPRRGSNNCPTWRRTFGYVSAQFCGAMVPGPMVLAPPSAGIVSIVCFYGSRMDKGSGVTR
jgi:hypothetical protein